MASLGDVLQAAFDNARQLGADGLDQLGQAKDAVTGAVNQAASDNADQAQQAVGAVGDVAQSSGLEQGIRDRLNPANWLQGMQGTRGLTYQQGDGPVTDASGTPLYWEGPADITDNGPTNAKAVGALANDFVNVGSQTGNLGGDAESLSAKALQAGHDIADAEAATKAGRMAPEALDAALSEHTPLVSAQDASSGNHWLLPSGKLMPAERLVGESGHEEAARDLLDAVGARQPSEADLSLGPDGVPVRAPGTYPDATTAAIHETGAARIIYNDGPGGELNVATDGKLTDAQRRTIGKLAKNADGNVVYDLHQPGHDQPVVSGSGSIADFQRAVGAHVGGGEPPVPPGPPTTVGDMPMPSEPTPPLDAAGAAGRSADDILGAVPKDYTPVPSELPAGMDPVNIDLTKYSPEVQAATTKMADAMGGFASSRFRQTNAATVQKALDLMHDPAQWNELLQRPMTSTPNAEEGVALNLSKQMAWDRALASDTPQDASEALRQAAFFDERVSAGASRQGGALQAQQIGMKALGSSFADWMERARAGRDLTPDELDQLKLVPTLTPDLGNALLRSMTQLVTGSAGAIYGYNQDQSDDEKTRIIKAVLGGATGLALGHVLTGGPMNANAVKDRWQGVYINNLLTPGTVAVKGSNDVLAMATGGVIRAEQRMLQAANDAIHGRFGDAATNVKVMTPEAIKFYAGEIASWRSGLQKFVDAINPSTVNRPLESYGKAVDRAPFEAPSAGQGAGSFISRTIQGLTDMSQEILQGGHDAANALALERGISQRALTEPYLAAQRALLMGAPEGNMGMMAQRLLDGLSKVPGIGLLLAPFHTIPANLLDKTFEHMPLIGMANMRKGHVADVLVHQANGLAGLMAARLAFGDGINGAGPQDPALHRAWVADGNQEWAVRLPGTDSWLSMKHLPPQIQGPLRELAAIEDAQRNAKAGQNPGIAGLEQFGSAIKSMDFFPQVLSVIDSGAIKSTNRGEELTKQGETLISRSTSDLVPSYDRAAAQIERGGTKPDSLGTQAAGQYQQQGMNPVAASALGAAQGGLQGAIPGLEKGLPDRRDSFGSVQPNDVQGLGAAFNPFGLTHTHPDTYANAYASAVSEPSKMPPSISVGTGSSITLRPDESARLQQLQTDIARPVVEQYAKSDDWGKMSVEQRQDVVQEIDKQSLKTAEQQLLGEMAQKGPLVDRVLDNRQAATDSLHAKASQAATFIGPLASPKP